MSEVQRNPTPVSPTRLQLLRELLDDSNGRRILFAIAGFGLLAAFVWFRLGPTLGLPWPVAVAAVWLIVSVVSLEAFRLLWAAVKREQQRSQAEIDKREEPIRRLTTEGARQHAERLVDEATQVFCTPAKADRGWMSDGLAHHIRSFFTRYERMTFARTDTEFQREQFARCESDSRYIFLADDPITHAAFGVKSGEEGIYLFDPGDDAPELMAPSIYHFVLSEAGWTPTKLPSSANAIDLPD